MDNIKIYLDPKFDKSLAPIRAEKMKGWWEDNKKTMDHAKHCLPLSMANSLGWYILSPGTFIVKWNGDHHADATIEHIEKSSHYEVDSHAAYGSFTVQAKFIPVTSKSGDFIYIKGMPNERSMPFNCMEALIEAWWSVGNFGLVFLLNQPGEFLIHKGQPLAQMFVYRGAAGAAGVDLIDGNPPGHEEWLKRRSRPGYHKDLDYMKGLTAGGTKIETHLTNWQSASKYDE
jgi:hypothetical protein